MKWYRLSHNAASDLKETYARDIFYEDGIPVGEEAPIRITYRKSYARLEIEEDAPKPLLKGLLDGLKKACDWVGGGVGNLSDPRKDKGSAQVCGRVLQEIQDDFSVRASSNRDLKNQLIRLGSNHSNLQKHIKPILDTLEG